jgi:hypothetical protein
MESILRLSDPQARSLTGIYDRLASLLGRDDPGRLVAFWEGLPDMTKKRHKPPATDSLAGIIAARIEGLKLTPYRVGKMSGTDTSTILRLISGEHTPTLETADRICHALDLILIVKSGSNLALDLVRANHEQSG